MRVRRHLHALLACPAALILASWSTAANAADDTPQTRTPTQTQAAPTPARPAPKPVDAEITSDTAAQFYEMRSPSGEQVIARRRFMTTLGVAVYDLFDQPSKPGGPTVTFRARMRYDADYGGNAEETAVTNYGRLVPGFSRGPVDLMYGYVEGRRFFNGWLGFKLGRQYVTDALGWWSFDGGEVKVTTPYYFAVEAYGGLEQRGGMPLSTPRFERDGVWRGDRSDYDKYLYPSFQPNDIAPAFGAAVESAGFTWLHGRLTYRRVYNTGSSNVSQFASGIRDEASYSGSRISQERVGYSIDASHPKLGGVKAGFVYDLYVAKISTLYASIDWYASQRFTLSADYDFFVPTFDADSIWNFFMAMPMNDLGLRASWEPTSRLAITGGVRGRAFTVQTEPEDLDSPTSPYLSRGNYYPSSSLDLMGGATTSARYRIGDGSIGARGALDAHHTGDRVGLDVFADRTIEARYVLQGRAGLWQWDDKLREDRDAVSFGYALGAGYKLFTRSLLLADFQHDMNRLVGQRFRAMLWLTVAIDSKGERVPPLAAR